MSNLHIKIITPARIAMEGDAEQVVANTKDGQITILPHHSPIVSILKPGELLIKKEGKEEPFAIAGGVIEMFDNTLVVLSDTAEHASEIDLEKSENEARKLAEELKQKESLDITTYNALSYRLERHIARIGVCKKWKK